MAELDPTFEEYRPALARIAYRMLGSLADADDVLQEAYIRWSNAERSGLRSPKALLYTIVTRLSIDRRREQESRREQYIGTWLPEPVVEGDGVEVAESVSLALLVVMESLSPQERAAYLLRKMFDCDYPEIAEVLGKTEAACRQLVSRAEGRLLDRRPRFDAPPEAVERLGREFLRAGATGDLAGLRKVLSEDAVLYSDGGGKRAAALAPILGADRIARFMAGVSRKFQGQSEARPVLVNGQPGFLILTDGHPDSVMTFAIDPDAGRIAEVFIVRNPDKLRRI